MKGEREVAGLRCSEVLADLSEYIDGQLPPSRVAQIEAHLRGCDVCERFGGEVSSLVKALRERLAEPEPLSSAVEQRLHERLAREIGAD